MPKEAGGRIRNSRGITLMNPIYKLYAIIVQKKLKEKMIIPDCQEGFRKGRSTMDNLYILNYIIQSKIAEEKGRICTFLAVIWRDGVCDRS